MLSFAINDKGILPDRMIALLAADGGILSENQFVPDQIQPASLDLRLGEVAYRVRASFLPGRTTVAQRIDGLKLHEISLTDGAVLETGCVYIVPLLESLALPDNISAAANPKSSTGRLDVFTRVIADETRGFDRIEAGYHGPLYAEISPRTFPVLVREGSRLSQIRFRRGHALLDADSLRALHARERLVDADNADVSEGVAVSVDLSGLGPGGLVGYRAKRHTGLIDVERRSGYAVADYWGDARAARQESHPRPERILYSGVQGSRAGSARLRRRDGAVRSAGWRIPRALCGFLRSRFRLRRRRRKRCARGARSAIARGALHSRTWANRRPFSLRENAGKARKIVRSGHRLELPGAEPQTLEALQGVTDRKARLPRAQTIRYCAITRA